jgi:hypothetical protein
MAQAHGPIPATETFAWSPDGQSLALAMAQRILIFDSSTWLQRESIAIPNAVEGGRLEWSPDGSLIAYKCELGLYAATLKGNEVRQLTVSKLVGGVVGRLSIPYKPGIQ